MFRSRLSTALLCLGAVAGMSLLQAMVCLAEPLRYAVELPQDDGTELRGTWYPFGVEPGRGYLGKDAKGRAFVTALRFDVPDLKQGQKVAFARLHLGCTGDRISDQLCLMIRGASEDSSLACSPSRLPSLVVKTEQSVIWRVAPSQRRSARSFVRTSPDVAPIINEILARPGWGRGHKSILLVIEPDSAAGAQGGCVAFEDHAGDDRRRLRAVLEVFRTDDDAFVGKVMLGRPTDSSITLNALSLIPLDLLVEYAPEADQTWLREPLRTDTIRIPPSEATEVVLDGLDRDTEYRYRVLYRRSGAGELRGGPQGRFHTQRPDGSPFVFTVQADSHMGTTTIGKPGRRVQMYRRTLENVAQDEPDFHIDLGDFSRIEVVGRRSAATLAEARERYASQRYFLADLCQEVPFYLVLGNHEGEQGWRLTLPDDSLLFWGAIARREMIPNPYPDRFYSGNPDTASAEPLGDYYAWEWGDALFVVIDPFRYTAVRPHGVGGRGPASLDGWDWTLGPAQYQWLYDTLHGSRATWKFVFAHHMTGGVGGSRRGEGYYGRGGIDAARYSVAHRPTFEWGGEDSAGTYVFDVMRPGWSHGPIHQMMVSEGVDILFRGHDHVFVYETLDGIVYQTCPTPADRKYSGGFVEAGLFSTGVKVSNPGHLRVTVSSDSARVDYVRSVLPADEPISENGVDIRNGDVSYTYTLGK